MVAVALVTRYAGAGLVPRPRRAARTRAVSRVRAGVQVALDCGLELVNGLLLVRLRGPQPGQVLPCTGFNGKGIAATWLGVQPWAVR